MEIMAAVWRFIAEHFWLIVIILTAYVLITAVRRTLNAAAGAEKLKASLTEMKKQKQEIDRLQAKAIDLELLRKLLDDKKP